MTSSSRHGFTLVEVLVVIAIMAVLAGLIFPAINKGLLTAKRNAAVTEARAIAGAIELFYRDYGWMPIDPSKQGFAPGPGNGNFGREQSEQNMTEQESREIIRVLMAVSGTEQINTRRKVYLDLDRISDDGELLDPWDNQYLIKLDLDYNGKLQFQSGNKQYNTRAIVLSTGPDGQKGQGNDNAAKDDIANVIIDLRNE